MFDSRLGGRHPPTRARVPTSTRVRAARMAAQARADTEEVINEFVRKCGGWEQMTDEQKTQAEQIRENLNRLIKESGYE